MSDVVTCDDCGKAIDQAQPYYTLTGTKVQMVDGALTVVEESQKLDYHVEHLPGYSVQGVPVEPPAAPVEGVTVATPANADTKAKAK